MRLESNEVVYSDGRHNAFTSLVKWKDRYWLSFRNATHHRSHDGRILVISSPDLKQWSKPVVAIDTPADDRDPKLVMFNDRLFVATGSHVRTFGDEAHLDGQINVTQMHSTLSATSDGIKWDKPWVVRPEFHFIWGLLTHGGRMYAAERKAKTTTVNGVEQRDYASNLLRSDDGHQFELVSEMSHERDSSEPAMAFLDDGRLIVFLRHDLDHYPEILLADPPYTQWQKVLDFPFKCNGPSLGLVGDTIVISGRAFYEDPHTPLLTSDIRARERGLLVMTVDLERRALVPQLMIPHTTGPLAPGDPGADEDARFNAPDISYASTVDLGGGRFAMSYYEGYKGQRSDIRLALLSL
jgi:hypothetical protein